MPKKIYTIEIAKVEKMGRKKKVMNAEELEQWLISKGAVPVSDEMKKKPWYNKAIQMPPCFDAEDRKSNRQSKTS